MCCLKDNFMPLFVTEWGYSCLFTLDTFQLRLTFVLPAGFDRDPVAAVDLATNFAEAMILNI